ncbi:MAG: hypothetical protein WKG01_08525 [Kofleriaceae bacterium]
MALVPAPKSRPQARVRLESRDLTRWTSVIVGGACAAVWAVVAVLGWMGPGMVAVAALTSLAAGMGAGLTATHRARTVRLWTSLPIDHASVEHLASQHRRSVVVKLDVKFGQPLSGAQRKALVSRLEGAGLRPRWEEGLLILASRRLRCADSHRQRVDSTPIFEFVQTALDALVKAAGNHDIERISVRSGS